MRGSCRIDRTTVRPEKKACLIRMFFKCKMLSPHEKTVRFREVVNVHPQMHGKAFGILLLKIDKTRLFAAGVTVLTLEAGHKKNERWLEKA
ncbi:MAG: hypothetical protein WC484_02110 [Candidatus Omnitrophota bacterium]